MTYRYVLNHNRKRVHRLAGLAFCGRSSDFGRSDFGRSDFGRFATENTDFLDTLLTGRDPAMREFLAEDGRRVAAVT